VADGIALPGRTEEGDEQRKTAARVGGQKHTETPRAARSFDQKRFREWLRGGFGILIVHTHPAVAGELGEG